jgi:hypothetical protein
MRTFVTECLLRQVLTAFDNLITVVENAGVGGGGGGAARITGPDVSTYDDTRGVAGDWSYNATFSGGTYFFKIGSAPHAWISWSAASS